MAALAEDSLVDLLLQLKKTTPEQARAILNSQPQVSYALMDLMVKLNAVNMDVFQRILASYGAAQASAGPAQAPVPQPQPVAQPAAAIPQHLAPQQAPQQAPFQQGGTPQPSYPSTAYPAYPNGYQTQIPPQPPQPAPYSSGSTGIPAHLEGLPDDQKAMIAQVLSMTSEQINALPPAERSSIIQLRATLGFPVG